MSNAEANRHKQPVCAGKPEVAPRGEVILEGDGLIMSKRTRQYLGILAALAAYYLVHEGAHLLYALLTGVFKQIRLMGLGVQIDVYAEHMTNMQLGIFCLVGALLHNDCFSAARSAVPQRPVRHSRRRGYERHRPSLPRVGSKVSFRYAALYKCAGILEAGTACLPAVFFRAMNLWEEL